MRNYRERIRWITQTAVMIALLIALQWGTAGTQVVAGQYITGSLVNCVLVTTVLLCGLWSGVAVACISPFCAFLLGIGPKLLQVVPAIALGNLVLAVGIYFLIGRKQLPVWRRSIGLLVCAAAKFLVLYIAVVQILIPAMGSALQPKLAETLTGMFSWPQLITALAGGTVALLISPLLKKAISRVW